MTTDSSRRFERLALAADLHLTWTDHLVTVATSRWEPGLFVYDLEYLTVETRPDRGRVKVVLYSRGAHVNFHVLRFELDDADYRRFEAFIGRVRAHRDRMRASIP